MAIKEYIFSIIDLLGINILFHFINRSKDICLMYHGIVPDDYPIVSWLLVKNSQFKKQMEYLKKYWEVVHIDDYLSGKFQTTKPKAIITFDDGYQNNYSTAYPILKELNLPATIYIVTDFIGTKKLFWFDKIIYSLQNNALTSLELSNLSYGLDNYTFNTNGKQRWKGIETLLTNIKALGTAKSEEVAEIIFDSVNPDTTNICFLIPLTKQQIIEMAQSGLIVFGTHTAHHEILTNLTITQAKQTIIRSMDAVNEILGEYPAHFCYPNGDYSGEIIDLMQRLNFTSAMTVRHDFINPKDFHKFEIPRIPVGAFDLINLFKAQVSGLKAFMSSIKQTMKG